MRKTLKFLICVLFSFQTFSWGVTGHRVVGEVAYKHLSPEAKVKVDELLNGTSLADACTWADEIKSDTSYDHLKPSHYTSVADHQHYHNERDDDIAAMIIRLSLSLSGWKGKSDLSPRDQLRFLAHLVGDIHQPLHVGRSDDRGGNSVRVLWFGKETNLHKMWDSDIIDRMQLSYTELADIIDREANINPAWTGEIFEESGLSVIMKESLELRALVYDFSTTYSSDISRLEPLEQLFKKYPHANRSIIENEFDADKVPQLEFVYNYRTSKVIRMRLLQAGLRLAYIINTIF